MKRLLVIVLTLAMVVFAAAAVAAQPSGKIVVYSASGPEITDPIIELFNKAHPEIEVVKIHAGTPELFSRLRAEANNPAADVMFGGDPLTYDRERDLFEPFDHPEKANFQTYDPYNIWQPFTIFVQPLMVNTKLVAPEYYPTTVKEVLANAEYFKSLGGIALSAPNTSSTGWTIVSGIATAHGWDFIAQLAPYLSVTNGSDAMFSAVRDGELPIGWINEDLGVQWEKAGADVKLIYPTDVATIQMDAYGLVKNGPNPEAAKVFMEFLGSKEVHEIAAEIVKRRSVRVDVAPPGDLPPLEGLNLYYASEPRDVVTDKFNQLIGN